MELKEEEVEKEEEVKEKQRCHDEAPNILFLAMVTCCHGGHKSINLNRLNVFMALFGIFGIYCFCEL